MRNKRNRGASLSVIFIWNKAHDIRHMGWVNLLILGTPSKVRDGYVDNNASSLSPGSPPTSLLIIMIIVMVIVIAII